MRILLVLLTFICAPAMAAITCTGPSSASFTFTAPSGSYSVPRDRDLPVGTLLTPWTGWQGANNAWNCSYQPNIYEGPVSIAAFSGVTLNAIGATTTSGSTSYMVFPSSLKGVGLIAMLTSSLPNAAWGEFTAPLNGASSSAGAWGSTTAGTGALFGFAYKFAFVKTGPMEGGVATVSGQIGRTGMDQRPISSLSNPAAITITGSATFNILSCSVSDIDVTLDTVRRSDFASATNLKTKPFQFTLRNCPAGMASIKYRLDPLTPIINASDGTFQNASGNDMAQGVGLRITTNDGLPMKFGDSSYQVAGYSTQAGNGALAIPLNVSYYRIGTAAAVKGGKVRGVAQLTVFYL